MASSQLHTSLRRETNQKLIAAWLVGTLVSCGISAHRAPLVLAGVVSGLLQGMLQRAAIRGATQKLASATSAWEVRAALTSIRWGRLQIGVLWTSLPIYLGLCFAMAQPGPAPTFPIEVFAAFFAEKLVREIITLPMLKILEQPS